MRRPTYRQVISIADALRALYASGFVGEWPAVVRVVDSPGHAAAVVSIGKALGLDFSMKRPEPAQPAGDAGRADAKLKALQERCDAMSDCDGRMWRAIDERLKRLERGA